MAIYVPLRGIAVAIQNATTTGNGDVVTPPASYKNHTFTIFAAAGVNAGAIQIESADDPNFSGTWVAQGSTISVVASTEVGAVVSGVFSALRARISTTIAGGGSPSCTVKYLGSAA